MIPFTYTPWVCHSYDYKRGTNGCSRSYDGYGSESKHTEDYEPIQCEKCGGMDWFLMRFRIPSINIRFVDGLARCEIPGERVLPTMKKIEYRGFRPEYESFEKAKELGYNVHTEQDWWWNFGAWANTIHYEIDHETLIPDDVFEAYKVYLGRDDVRRAIYRSDMVECDPDDPAGFHLGGGKYLKQINQRVEYY